jgi:hypothetical protein
MTHIGAMQGIVLAAVWLIDTVLCTTLGAFCCAFFAQQNDRICFIHMLCNDII